MQSGDKIINKIKQISFYINKIIIYFCTFTFSLILLFMVIGIFYRYVLNSPISWMTNVSRYVLIYTGLFAISVTLYEKQHIAINFIYNNLPKFLSKALNIILRLLVFYYLYILIKHGWIMAIDTIPQILPTLRISMFWVFVSVPISLTISLVQLVLTSIVDIYENTSLYKDDF